MAESLIVYNAPPVLYSQVAFPALKFFLPFDEGSGTTCRDSVSGAACNLSLSNYSGGPITDLSSLWTTPNAISADNITLAATSGGSVNLGISPQAAMPAPNGKVAVLLAVWGPTPDDLGSVDFGYIRFGSPLVATDPNMFVVSQNSKPGAANNCFKSTNGDPGIQVNWTPKINTAQAMATVIDYASASLVTNDYWIDSTKASGNSTSTIYPFLRLGSGIGISADGACKTSIYSLQWWFFDAKPTDSEMAAACLWTRDNALRGNKAPYPGWLYKT